MKSALLIAFLFVTASISNAAEIAFFNTEVLGHAAGDNISLLENQEENLIQPKIIQVDVENGIYSASSVYYPADKIQFNELVSQIENKYQVPRHIESDSGDFISWRVESKQFAISFANEIEEEMYRVIYVKFRKFDFE